MATCYEMLGHSASAWGHYREVVVLATKIGDKTRIDIARQRIAALEPRLPKLTIRAPKLAVAGLVVTRDDAPLWRDCRNMKLPESLAWRLEYFRHSGRVLRYPSDIFAAPNWLAVLLGQGVIPAQGDPLVARHDPARLDGELRDIRHALARTADTAIAHSDYIQRHCRAGS